MIMTKDQPKTGFAFTTKNETGAKNEIIYSAETETKITGHFWL